MPKSIFLDVAGYDARRENPSSPGTYIYDKPTDWSKQRAAGAQLAFIKASEFVEDKGFLINWNAAGDAGMIRGAYHFIRPTEPLQKQLDVFISTVRKGGLHWTGDKRTSDKLILDLEAGGNPPFGGLAYKDVMTYADQWMEGVRLAFPLHERVNYAGYYTWKDLYYAEGARTEWAKSCTWWMPGYPLDPYKDFQPAPYGWDWVVQMARDISNGAYAPLPLPPWGTPTYRQFSAHVDSREVPGHPAIKNLVDVNVSMVDIPEIGVPPVVIPPVIIPPVNTGHACPTCGLVHDWPNTVESNATIMRGNPNVHYPNWDSMPVIKVLTIGTRVLTSTKKPINPNYIYITKPVEGWIWKLYVEGD